MIKTVNQGQEKGRAEKNICENSCNSWAKVFCFCFEF